MMKKLIGIFLGMLLIGTVLPVSGMVNENYSIIEENRDDDWWTMFGHDEAHTRYSTSSVPENNNVLWSTYLGLSVKSSPAIVNGKVYIGAYSDSCPPRGLFYCLDAYDGDLEWIYQQETFGDVQSSPAVYEDKVYFGTLDGKLYCLDANNGNKIWRFDGANSIFSSPVVVDGYVYINSHDIFCINAETGALVWQSDTPGGQSSPAVYDGKVYAGTNMKSFHCFDAYTGEQLWWFKPWGTTYVISSPVVANDRVYFGGMESFDLFCLDADPSDGVDEGITDSGQGDGFDIIWLSETNAAVWSSPALYDSKVYVGSFDSKLYCFDAISGDHLWNYSTGGWVTSSPAVADGKVIVGSEDSKVYCIDAQNGDLVWDYETGEKVVSCPGVADGIVYIGSYDGYIYAFGGETQENNPPYNPTDPNPEHGAVDVNIDTDLSWTGGDPDPGDTVTYDIYFGVESNPPLIESDHPIESYELETLDYMTQYYWKIVARDQMGETNNISAIWTFTTEEEETEPLLEIGEIAGGIGVVADIQNTGDVDIENIEWTITIENGLILLIPKEGNVSGIIDSLPSQETDIVGTNVFGLGNFDITVEVKADDVPPISKTATAFIIGPFVIII